MTAHLGDPAPRSNQIFIKRDIGAVPTDGKNCPLCHITLVPSKQYEGHVARHLEELSLFALPRNELDELDSDLSNEDQRSVHSLTNKEFYEDEIGDSSSMDGSFAVKSLGGLNEERYQEHRENELREQLEMVDRERSRERFRRAAMEMEREQERKS